MKCSHCYEENQPWEAHCHRCGKPVLRLELCPTGHLLPPGVQECPVCPSLWPEVDPFAGPSVLRGFLWVEKGRLCAASDPGKELAYIEVRDRKSPLALTVRPTGAVCIVGEEDRDVACRVLMRPEGVRVCRKNQPGRHSGRPVYQPLPPGERMDIGGTSFRHVHVQPPPWVEKLAGTLRAQD